MGNTYSWTQWYAILHTACAQNGALRNGRNLPDEDGEELSNDETALWDKIHGWWEEGRSAWSCADDLQD